MHIKDWIFNRYCMRRPVRTKAFPQMEKVQRVLLLFESDLTEKNLQIKQLQKELSQQGREVCAWGYADKKEGLSPWRILTRRDINLLGRPKSEARTSLTRQHFDLVIDLSMHDVLPLRYLLLEADGDFKAGRQTAEPYLTDLMIALPEGKDQVYLFDQIMYYLQNIQSND